MNEKQRYFVTIDTEEIRKMSIPDNGIEYEIVANSDEVKEIEMLFMEKKKNAKHAVQYLGKPFDEWGADDERTEYDRHLLKIYEVIYELGTGQTKDKLKQIGLFQ